MVFRCLVKAHSWVVRPCVKENLTIFKLRHHPIPDFLSTP